MQANEYTLEEPPTRYNEMIMMKMNRNTFIWCATVLHRQNRRYLVIQMAVRYNLLFLSFEITYFACYTQT